VVASRPHVERCNAPSRRPKEAGTRKGERLLARWIGFGWAHSPTVRPCAFPFDAALGLQVPSMGTAGFERREIRE
jgi:hypothetical protein